MHQDNENRFLWAERPLLSSATLKARQTRHLDAITHCPGSQSAQPGKGHSRVHLWESRLVRGYIVYGCFLKYSQYGTLMIANSPSYMKIQYIPVHFIVRLFYWTFIMALRALSFFKVRFCDVIPWAEVLFAARGLNSAFITYTLHDNKPVDK